VLLLFGQIENTIQKKMPGSMYRLLSLSLFSSRLEGMGDLDGKLDIDERAPCGDLLAGASLCSLPLPAPKVRIMSTNKKTRADFEGAHTLSTFRVHMEALAAGAGAQGFSLENGQAPLVIAPRDVRGTSFPQVKQEKAACWC